MKKRNSPIDIPELHERIAKRGADTQLSRGEASALIASCLAGGGRTDRAARNRIGGRLDEARLRGDDYQTGGLARLPNGKFTVDEIGRWASKHYDCQLFKHLPDKPRDHPLGKRTEGLALQGSGKTAVLPGNLEDCHAEISRLRQQLTQTQADTEQAVREHKKEVASRFSGKK